MTGKLDERQKGYKVKRVLFLFMVIALSVASIGVVRSLQSSLYAQNFCSSAIDRTPAAIENLHVTLSPVIESNAFEVSNIGFTSENMLLVIDTEQGILQWDFSNDEYLNLFPIEGDNRVSILNEGGNTIATYNSNGTIDIWDVATKQKTNTIEAGSDMSAFVLSSDGSILAFSNLYQLIHIWNLQNQSEELTINARNLPIVLVFSKDNSLLGYGTHGDNDSLGQIVTGVIELTSKNEISIFEDYSLPIKGISFHPYATRLAIINQNANVQVLDFCHSDETYTITGHEGEVTATTFSPDGNFLVSGDDVGTIKLWDTSDWHEIATVINLNGDIKGITFNQDSTLMAAYTDDRSIYVWEILSEGNN